MLFGKYPWELYKGWDDNKILSVFLARSGENLILPDKPGLTPDLKSMLRKMICYDQHKRLDWEELFQSKIGLTEGTGQQPAASPVNNRSMLFYSQSNATEVQVDSERKKEAISPQQAIK